ncbi:hypothetical protein ABIA27_005878 [Sinorhizobium fredii]
MRGFCDSQYALQDLGRGNLDAEAFEADIVTRTRREEADGGDAEVLEDLGAETDFQPFAFASLRFRMGLAFMLALSRRLRDADADRALAQIDDNAPTLAGDALHDLVDLAVIAEDVRADILEVKTDRNIDAVANVAENDGEMLHRIPGQ